VTHLNLSLAAPNHPQLLKGPFSPSVASRRQRVVVRHAYRPRDRYFGYMWNLAREIGVPAPGEPSLIGSRTGLASDERLATKRFGPESLTT
jgi:hypothetical protein